MTAKYKSQAHWSVRTPEARQALQRWLEHVPAHIRERGRDYLTQGRVARGWAEADHFVEADVLGGSEYRVTLFLTRGKWTSSCTCPMAFDCKHAVAAALAWIQHEGVDFETETTLSPPPPSPDRDALRRGLPPFLGTPGKKPPPQKITFRATWAPILAEKLGRPLRDDEGQMLGQLSAAFAEFRNSFGHLNALTLRTHGFGQAIPRNAPAWGPIFADWWPPSAPPTDPWQLWQYIAYSLEQNGHLIPEVMRPMTDTATVRAAIEELSTRRDIDVWRRALGVALPEAVASGPGTVRPEVANLRVRLSEQGDFFLETRLDPDKPWKAPSPRWFTALAEARPADFEALPPAEAALATTLAMERYHLLEPKSPLSADVVASILRSGIATRAIVLPDGTPFAIEAAPLGLEAFIMKAGDSRLSVRLVKPDGTPAVEAKLLTTEPQPLYQLDGRVWRGPPPLPTQRLPMAALGDAALMTRLRKAGLRLPETLELKHRVVVLRPLLRMWLADATDVYLPQYCCVQLVARATDPVCEQHWCGIGGWQWTKGGAPPPRRSDDPVLEFDLAPAQAVSARFGDFRLAWNDWYQAWVRPITKAFPDEVLAWHAELPKDVTIEAAPELAALFKAPLRAHMDVTARPTDASHDWFDITVALRVEDTKLTPEEIALLLKARGKWVRLPKHGWQRLELEGLEPGDAGAATLDRLGLTPTDVLATGRTATHRMHALQLAAEAAALEARDAKLAHALRERVARLARLPKAKMPSALTATLRPYQQEGFQFLAHLSALGFGGVLADDMGLGKTVQALAWMLHLAAASRPTRTKFHALVVCPKSVMHGWQSETARFAPTLTTDLFSPAHAARENAPKTSLLIANYTQLRLHRDWFSGIAWDVVILDEGQFIKNPASQIAGVCRGLKAQHRLVLTGTPIENHLTDLWSLFAFAQPGLLGPQSAFRRQYDESDPAALSRLHRRVTHFLLRRTKLQAAPDLPPRTEDEIAVDLEPAQRKLYDAELKRARQQLLGIDSDRALDKVRFNILSSLLRLRQICCHPALLDPAHAAMPSAKLDALLERLEELRDEGHQVLVFSQFVEMLHLIRSKLVEANIGHLLLTGATENRAELVDEFQTDPSKTVFLLSLKAAGFGLNLTAASYAVLYDPWWNPAVEAQAIDRTHRIGQTRPVIAYRLLASNTIEQKIRLLQQEKAALAAAVVQEESLAKILDLDSLRRILA